MKYSLTLYHSLVAEYVGLVSLFRDFHENHRIDRVEETQDDMFHCLALGFHNINLAIIDLPFYDETTRFTEPIAGRLLSPSAWCISIHDSGTCKIHLLSPLTSFIPIWVGIGYIRKLFPPHFHLHQAGQSVFLSLRDDSDFSQGNSCTVYAHYDGTSCLVQQTRSMPSTRTSQIC